MVYAVGNSEFHTGALAWALRRPGVVLAHEVRLPQLYAFAAHHGVLEEGFGEAVRRMHGDGAAAGYPALLPVAEAGGIPFRMASELIEASEAFLTTSAFAAGLAREEAPGDAGARVGVLPFAHRVVPARPEPDEAHPLVATFGVVNASKAVGMLLRAFAEVAEKEPAARLAVVGPASPADLADAQDLIRRLGVAEAVAFTGEVGDEEWDRHLARTTVAVQLRSSTNGEYSAAVAECLSFGVPTVVTDLGAMRELPDGVAAKVRPHASASEVAGEIVVLLRDPSRRAALGEAARAHAAAHSFEVAAAALYRALAGGSERKSRHARPGFRTSPASSP
jgi:glycosyltransferase involved in cell wall biosynthesis